MESYRLTGHCLAAANSPCEADLDNMAEGDERASRSTSSGRRTELSSTSACTPTRCALPCRRELGRSPEVCGYGAADEDFLEESEVYVCASPESSPARPPGAVMVRQFNRLNLAHSNQFWLELFPARIASYLSVRDLAQVARVSRITRLAADQQRTWREVTTVTFRISAEASNAVEALFSDCQSCESSLRSLVQMKRRQAASPSPGGPARKGREGLSLKPEVELRSEYSGNVVAVDCSSLVARSTSSMNGGSLFGSPVMECDSVRRSSLSCSRNGEMRAMSASIPRTKCNDSSATYKGVGCRRVLFCGSDTDAPSTDVCVEDHQRATIDTDRERSQSSLRSGDTRLSPVVPSALRMSSLPPPPSTNHGGGSATHIQATVTQRAPRCSAGIPFQRHSLSASRAHSCASVFGNSSPVPPQVRSEMGSATQFLRHRQQKNMKCRVGIAQLTGKRPDTSLHSVCEGGVHSPLDTEPQCDLAKEPVAQPRTSRSPVVDRSVALHLAAHGAPPSPVHSRGSSPDPVCPTPELQSLHTSTVVPTGSPRASRVNWCGASRSPSTSVAPPEHLVVCAATVRKTVERGTEMPFPWKALYETLHKYRYASFADELGPRRKLARLALELDRPRDAVSLCSEVIGIVMQGGLALAGGSGGTELVSLLFSDLLLRSKAYLQCNVAAKAALAKKDMNVEQRTVFWEFVRRNNDRALGDICLASLLDPSSESCVASMEELLLSPEHLCVSAEEYVSTVREMSVMPLRKQPIDSTKTPARRGDNHVEYPCRTLLHLRRRQRAYFNAESFSLEMAYDQVVQGGDMFARVAFLAEVIFWRGPSTVAHLYQYFLCNEISFQSLYLLYRAEHYVKKPFHHLMLQAWAALDRGNNEAALNFAELSVSLLNVSEKRAHHSSSSPDSTNSTPTADPASLRNRGSPRCYSPQNLSPTPEGLWTEGGPLRSGVCETSPMPNGSVRVDSRNDLEQVTDGADEGNGLTAAHSPLNGNEDSDNSSDTDNVMNSEEELLCKLNHDSQPSAEAYHLAGASRADPLVGLAYFTLGFMGQSSDEVVEAYVKYLLTNPSPSRRAVVYNNLAGEFMGKNDCEMAKRLLKVSIQCYPKFTTAYNNLARCYSKLGEVEESYNLLSSVIVRDMEVEDDSAEDSDVLASSKRDLLVNSELDVSPTASTCSLQAETFTQRVRCLIGDMWFDTNRATELHPRMSYPYRMRAAMLMDRGAHSEAIQELRKLLRLNLNPVDAVLRSRFLMDTGKVRQAMDGVVLAVLLDPLDSSNARLVQSFTKLFVESRTSNTQSTSDPTSQQANTQRTPAEAAAAPDRSKSTCTNLWSCSDDDEEEVAEEKEPYMWSAAEELERFMGGVESGSHSQQNSKKCDTGDMSSLAKAACFRSMLRVLRVTDPQRITASPTSHGSPLLPTRGWSTRHPSCSVGRLQLAVGGAHGSNQSHWHSPDTAPHRSPLPAQLESTPIVGIQSGQLDEQASNHEAEEEDPNGGWQWDGARGVVTWRWPTETRVNAHLHAQLLGDSMNSDSPFSFVQAI